MAVDLFAGLPVRDFKAAVEWYTRFFGEEPGFFPNDIEAVWELDEHRFMVVELMPDKAGGGLHTLFVDDLEERVTQMAEHGIEPTKRETYSNGVRKVTYHDPDGNEIGFGGPPL